MLQIFKRAVSHINLLSSKMNITPSEYIKLSKSGISKEIIDQQYKNLVNGPKPLNLNGPCVLNNGIIPIEEKEHSKWINSYDTQIESKTITMFTPASGAATRMFKHLINPESNPKLRNEFIENLKRFSFYNEIEKSGALTDEDKIAFVLNSDGLNYAKLPKAMIGFHLYENEMVLAIDEQFVEGVKYLSNAKEYKFHFTVSPEHEEIVKEHLKNSIPKIESKTKAKIDVEFSFQEKHTDTIALYENGAVVRDESNDVLLRPGGHGALIHNLNEIDSDVIFIKNIDNITREEYHLEVVKYKKVIGAYLLDIQSQIFNMLGELDSDIAPNRLKEITDWIKKYLKIEVSETKADIREMLNKPIRVCGMVKNEGKSGGGPFWVDNAVQIVEGAQLDESIPEIKEMVIGSSHFNPVDIVCGTKNYRGEKFNLLDFTDETAFFTTNKSYKGKDIKALEHPGLWNGAMANWLSFFVEVPVSTFNPVKTVNDLLTPQHCNK